jgi:hypothetical protein
MRFRGWLPCLVAVTVVATGCTGGAPTMSALPTDTPPVASDAVAPSAAPATIPTASPTLDQAQIKVIPIRALAVDGNVIYGDQHIGGNKYEFVAYNLETGAIKDLGPAADAAAISDGRLIWTTYTIEGGPGPGHAIPGCGWSVAHWRMYKLLSLDAKPSLLAKGDSHRPGWGQCADAMPPLIAFDGDSVSWTGESETGLGDTITIIDFASGRRIRKLTTAGAINALAMSTGSIAYLEVTDGGDANDNRLMLAEAGGTPAVLAEHAAWFAMSGDRVAWIRPGSTSGETWTAMPVRSPAVQLPDAFTPTDLEDPAIGMFLGPWDSLVAVSSEAVAWSWPSERSQIAYWREGRPTACLIPTPGGSGLGRMRPVALGQSWLVWTDDGFRPEEWQDSDDPYSYAVPISALNCR